MNHKRFLTYIFSVLIVLCFNTSYSLAESHYLTILHTNDIHGQLKPIEYDKKHHVGGFSARAKLIKKFKSENKNVLILDAGDIAQGTLFFKYFDGVPDVKFMSKIGYDAAELGNHEFDKGTSVVEKMIESANFPFLCANIRFVNNPELQKKVKPYIIKDYNGFKVGIIGLIAQDLKTLVTNSDDFEALDPVETTRNIIKEIGSKVDLIVVLSHMGFKQDLNIAKEVPEINIIVGGHSHTFLKYPKRVFHGGTSTLIVQDGEFGVDLGHLDVKFENKHIEKYYYDLIPVDGKNEDRFFTEEILKLSQKIDFQANQKIGEIKIPLETRKNKVRSQLTNSGSLIIQAMKAKCPDVDIYLLNAGAIRSNKYINAGFMTEADVFELYPFEDAVVIAEIKGSELKSVLETSSRALPELSGSFLQSLGLEYSVNTAGNPQLVSNDGLHILKEGGRVFAESTQ